MLLGFPVRKGVAAFSLLLFRFLKKFLVLFLFVDR